MKSKIFKISIIAIIVILITTFIFIGKTNSSKNNLSKNLYIEESKEKVKQKDIQEKTENQKELPKERNESVDVVESPKEEVKKIKYFLLLLLHQIIQMKKIKIIINKINHNLIIIKLKKNQQKKIIILI